MISISLDNLQNGAYTVGHAKEKNAEELEITIGTALSGFAYYKLEAVRPDKAQVESDELTISNGKITVPLQAKFLVFSGIVKAQVFGYKLTDGEITNIKASDVFELSVSKSVAEEARKNAEDDPSLKHIYPGEVDESAIADGAITKEKLTEEIANTVPVASSLGKNLYNPKDPDILQGKLLDAQGEPTTNNNNFCTSGWIEVIEGQTYFATVTRNGTRSKNIRAYAFYNEDKEFISGSASNVAGGSITAPEGARYCRYCTYSDLYGGADRQFEAFMQTDYEPYTVNYESVVGVPLENNKALMNVSSTNNWIETILSSYAFNKNHALEPSQSYTSCLPIYVGGYDKVALQYAYEITGFPYAVLFFDKNMVCVAHYTNTNYPQTALLSPKSNGSMCWTIPIPEGAEYFAFSVMNAWAINLMAYGIKGENVRAYGIPYEEYAAAYRFEQTVAPTESYIKTPFSGKKLVALGDSITADRSLVSANSLLPFPRLVASYLNMSCTNYGIGASEIAQHPAGDTTYTPMCVRYTEMDDDADLVIVAGGTNDWAHNHTPLGQMGDTATDTFYGALDTLCKGLMNKYAVYGKQILFLTPIKRDRGDGTETGKEYFSPNALGYTLDQFATAIKEVCGFYGIPVLDMFNECLLNPIFPTMRLNYFMEGQGGPGTDGTHPNFEGNKIMAKQIAGKIASLKASFDFD